MVLVSFSTFSLVVSTTVYHQKLIGYLNSKNPHIKT